MPGTPNVTEVWSGSTATWTYIINNTAALTSGTAWWTVTDQVGNNSFGGSGDWTYVEP